MITKSNISYPRLALLAFLPAILLLAAGCGLNNDDDGEVNENQTVITQMTTSGNGTVLSDDTGRAIYLFSRDVKGRSNCDDSCLQNWPAVYAELLDRGTGLDPANFDTLHRGEDEIQTTYKGWPLYYFAGDEQPGDVNGDGVNSVWFVAKADYSLMIASEQLTGADGNNYLEDYTVGDGLTTYFTDSEGRTLYAFANDEFNTNNFTNEDFSNNSAWPIFYTEIASLPNGMSADDFDVIDVHGQQQLTFKGWPLYYFGQDEAPGDNKGVSVPQPGVWPIINNNIDEAPAPSS